MLVMFLYNKTDKYNETRSLLLFLLQHNSVNHQNLSLSFAVADHANFSINKSHFRTIFLICLGSCKTILTEFLPLGEKIQFLPAKTILPGRFFHGKAVFPPSGKNLPTLVNSERFQFQIVHQLQQKIEFAAFFINICIYIRLCY